MPFNTVLLLDLTNYLTSACHLLVIGGKRGKKGNPIAVNEH